MLDEAGGARGGRRRRRVHNRKGNQRFKVLYNEKTFLKYLAKKMEKNLRNSNRFKRWNT